MSRSRFWKRLDLTVIVLLVALVIAALVILWGLAATGALDSDNAAAWVTAVSTALLVIVAASALWPAANQVKQAARASAESHRPYVSLGTRVSVKGLLYLDLVNHGDRAALDVSAVLSFPPLDNVQNTEMPEAPFGLVTYLAPNERRSVVYSSPENADKCPSELVAEIAYASEDGTPYKAKVTHDIDALKLILSNPDDIRTPEQLLKKGLDGIRNIVNGAVQQVAEARAQDRRPRLRDCLERLVALLRAARAREHS